MMEKREVGKNIRNYLIRVEKASRITTLALTTEASLEEMAVQGQQKQSRSKCRWIFLKP